ncbi:MAG: type 4a pilus biogenesis protein PilO [Candidatus Chisholmbacteria bacterium]|nr:type 4a pilus biogenesis protein PilO [Candidatus Chisholmbacteria bacterium]
MVFDYRREYYRYRQYYGNLRKIYERPIVKVSFFVLLSFMTVTFFSLLAIRPTLTTIGLLVREIEDKRKVDAALDTKIAALNVLQGELGNLSEELVLVENVLPADAAADRLLLTFEYLAAQNNVTLVATDIDPEGEEGRQSLGEQEVVGVPVSLTVGGNFADVKAFLETIERLDRIIILDEVMLLSSSQGVSRQGFPIIAELTGAALMLPASEIMNNHGLTPVVSSGFACRSSFCLAFLHGAKAHGTLPGSNGGGSR